MTTIDQDLVRAFVILREQGPMTARELGKALNPDAGPMRARLRGSEVLRRLRDDGTAYVESGIGTRTRPFLWRATDLQAALAHESSRTDGQD